MTAPKPSLPGSGCGWSASQRPLLLVEVQDGVGEASRVVPRDVLRRIRLERRLVHVRLALVEQPLEVAAEQVPLEVVRLLTVLAVDDQPSHAPRLEQRLEDLEVLEIGEGGLPPLPPPPAPGAGPLLQPGR